LPQIMIYSPFLPKLSFGLPADIGLF